MDDKRFKIGFWDIVIQKETWKVMKIIGFIITVAIVASVLVWVCSASRAKAVAAEKSITENVSSFIEEYSTLDIDKETMTNLYEQGKKMGSDEK